ncbi:hypothetical protein ACLRDC_18480 [Gluconacetobacter sacchari]
MMIRATVKKNFVRMLEIFGFSMRKKGAKRPFSVGDMVRVHTGWPRNYDLDFIGRIEDIKVKFGPEDHALPCRERHRFGIKLPYSGLYYFSAVEIAHLH